MDSTAVSAQSLIDTKSISFSYGTHKVLSNVSFSIHAGDFLAIIGPNGSGKTTLIKIILGLLKPNHGHVWILEKPLQEFSDWRRIGYVPQKATHFDPSFPVSVKEVVAMGLLSVKKSPGLTKKEEEFSIKRALGQVGMGSLENRRIGSLSGFLFVGNCGK